MTYRSEQRLAFDMGTASDGQPLGVLSSSRFGCSSPVVEIPLDISEIGVGREPSGTLSNQSRAMYEYTYRLDGDSSSIGRPFEFDRLVDTRNQVYPSDSLVSRPFGDEVVPDSRLEVGRVTFDVMETECDCIVEVPLG